jgi:AraC-like DNA-binding protein
MPASAPTSVQLYRFAGLVGGRHALGPRDAMPTFVRHNDVSLNFLERGRTQVLLATGYRYRLGPGRLAVFWSAIPHKVEMYAPRSILQWFVVPLGTFMRWALPNDFMKQLMRGRVYFEPTDEEGAHDKALLDRCRASAAQGDVEARAIMLLELEARIRRLAAACSTQRQPASVPNPNSGSGAERMLLLIAEHFREELTAEDVAAHVGLHRTYAAALFRQHVGMGLHDYITECRLSHAKALLATTNGSILDVALQSGFGSISQFHAVFKQSCGLTPGAFRKELRHAPTA